MDVISHRPAEQKKKQTSRDWRVRSPIFVLSRLLCGSRLPQNTLSLSHRPSEIPRPSSVLQAYENQKRVITSAESVGMVVREAMDMHTHTHTERERLR